MRLPRTLALLPALAALLVPKCPLCFAAYLTAAGCGAALARAVAPIVVGGARVVAFAVVIALALRVVAIVWRRTSRLSGVSAPRPS